VYVGGNFTSAGGVSGADYIARWDGTTWSGLLSGTFGISNTVNTIAISGTEVSSAASSQCGWRARRRLHRPLERHDLERTA
jgi:hypothetical protein